MNKSKFSKLIATLSALTLAATSAGFTAFAVEEALSESTDFAAAENTLPAPDILSYKEEVLPDGTISTNLYHSDGSRFVPNQNTSEISKFGDIATAAFPSSYDLRNYKLVTPVGDQGASGMCWAYAAIASSESNMIKRGFGTTNLSEQHLTWFVKGKYNSNKNELTYGDGRSSNFGLGVNNTGFNGAFFGDISAAYIPDAIMKLASWSGPVKESYDKSLEHYSWATDGAVSESYRNLSDIHLQDVDYIYSYGGKNDTITRNAMKSLLTENGALVIRYYADESYLSSKSAYFTGGKYLDGGSINVNHSVTVVGWDDNYSRTNFNSSKRPSSNGAWIVKNSWGTSWGDDGYFYLSYEEPLDGIASYQVEAKNNYKKVYQYDSQYGSGWGYTDYNTSAAHIFTATEDGTISAASFGFEGNTNTPYTVRIYKGVTAGKPASGTLAVTESGTAKYAGYHTHELSTPVSIKKGELFSVVVSLGKGGSYFWVDDHCYAANESFMTNTSAITSSTQWADTNDWTFSRQLLAGYSYTIGDDGKIHYNSDKPIYKKGTYSGDVCVKAFTKNNVKPALPTGLTLSAGNGSITASWNAVSGADYYTVFTYYNGKYTKVGTPVSTKFTITGLTNGTKYGVLVLAANSAGSSAFTKSDIKCATPAAAAKPALPTGLKLTPGNGSITASWNAVSGADYYSVFTYYNGKYTKVGTPVSTKYTITGLTNGTKYGVLVLAANSAGSSAFTKADVKCATPVAVSKPALPTGLKLAAGDGRITAAWNPVSDATYYTVYTYYDGKYHKVGTPVSTRFTISGLTNGTKYGVLVLATNSAGSSAFTKADVRCATPSAN